MKRFSNASMLVVLLAGSALGQTKVIVAKIPQSAYDLTRDPAVRLSTSSSAGVANAAVANTAINTVGAQAGQIKQPIIVPAGQFFIADTVDVGLRSDGKPIMGGSFLGVGGYTPVYSEDSTAYVGGVTRFVWSGGRLANEAMFLYAGRHWAVGPFELYGFRLQHTSHRNSRDTMQKCPTGLRISKMDANIPCGHLSGALSLMGFEKGIEVTSTPYENHCDALRWDELYFDTCDDGYYVDNNQSMGHQILFASTGSNIQRVFNFRRGGDLDCQYLHLNGPNQTILTIGGGSWNEGVFRVHCRIDNNADNPVLVHIESARTTPVSVIITGSVGNNVDYTAADLVQIDPPVDDGRHKVYINFSGESAKIADFNGAGTLIPGTDPPPF